MRKKLAKTCPFNYCLIVLTALYFLSFTGCGTSPSDKTDLRIDFITNLGTDPIFSWKTGGVYQILVATDLATLKDGSGNVWDSGKQTAVSTLQIPYSGPELKTGERYFALVRTWNEDGIDQGLSKPVEFVVPLNYPGDWKAEWLTHAYSEEAPLPLFRRSFKIESPESIEYARFYIAAPGYYEASLNGKKIGESVLDPGQTNYEDYTYYSSYDIDPTDLSTESALGVMLGNGWYNQNEVWKGQAEYSHMVYGQPVFMCQLVIHRIDGTVEVIGSDKSWQWAPGPITYSNIYGGEHYDAQREVEGWNSPGEPEGNWHKPETPEVHPTMLYEQFAEPIRVMDEIHPIGITDMGNGTYMMDFGQNMAGWMELSIEGEPGQEISVQCTEVLDQEGNLDPRTTGIRATKVIQTQKYTCKGGGLEKWNPRFTYFGFRYAQVSGLKQAPDLETLIAKVIYSSVDDVGSFTCAEENINKLHELSRWSIIGNIHSIPTDCPHREKCGWTGDSHAMIQPMIYNYDAQRFFQKYMFDMRSSAREEKEELYFGYDFHDRSIVMKPSGVPTMIVPGKRTSGCASPDWGTAMVQIPWYLYLYYDDRVTLENFYPDMKFWVEYIEGIKEDGLIPHGLGDWCPPGGNINIDCPVTFSSSAFHILDVSIMEKAAAVMGKKEDQVLYSRLLKQLKVDFNHHFFNPEKGNYGSSQTANVMALDMEIVPKGMERKVCMAIIKNMYEGFDGFLNTGIFGLARIFKVLAENGYESEVYRILTKTGENSFACMWDQFDATTLWERLPTNSEFGADYIGSMNHPMQAGFDSWFYSGIAGINPSTEGPGFQLIEFKPYLTRQLESASASYESKSGNIESSWVRGPELFSWKIQIPPQSKGVIYVPTYGEESVFTVNGSSIDPVGEVDGFTILGELESGSYQIERKSK